MPIWEVELFVYGPVKVRDCLEFRTQKGNQEMDPFFSDVKIRDFNEGLKINVTAYAPTSDLANNAALVFVGQMLDCLVIEMKGEIPLFLSFDNRRTTHITRDCYVKRIITEEELKQAFKESRELSLNEPVFLKSYGWFRKGLYTEDPFDKFLAFYNTIELVASKYHPKNEISKKGSKSQIWESFKFIWGDCNEWPLYIKGNNKWIDYNYETRKDIAHGLSNVNVEEVDKVTSLIDTIQKVSYLFLRDWRTIQLRSPGLLLEFSEV